MQDSIAANLSVKYESGEVKMEMNFRTEQFDFDREFANSQAAMKKPNILVCGATGVGKSSLLNDIFGKNVAVVSEGVPVTRGVQRYASDELDVVLYDSEGYEIGNEKLAYFRDNIIGIIDKLRMENTGDFINEVWYCISAANKRFTDTDITVINEIRARVPVAIVFTQIDSVDEDELDGLVSVAESEFPDVPHFATCVTDDPDLKEALEPYDQRDDMMEWAVEHCGEASQSFMIASLNIDIDAKKDRVTKVIIPIYAGLSIAAAAIPLPFSDCAVLVPMQIKQAADIINAYNVANFSSVATAVIQQTVISQVGKMLAKSLGNQLLKLIPGLGSVAGGVANSFVAASITVSMGLALSEICYQYAKKRENGENVEFVDFLTSSRFADTIKEIGQSDLAQSIIDSVMHK